MLLFNVREKHHGFTLYEILTILVIVGILCAITAPSFLRMLNRGKVNDATNKLRGAFQEVQREAMRKGKTCTVYLPDATTQAQLISDCFITSEGTSSGFSGIPNGLPIKKLDAVAIKSELNTTTPQRIRFSFRGNTTDGGTSVLYMSDNSTPEKRCFVISNGIGIMRTGEYTASIFTSIDDSHCNTRESQSY